MDDLQDNAADNPAATDFAISNYSAASSSPPPITGSGEQQPTDNPFGYDPNTTITAQTGTNSVAAQPLGARISGDVSAAGDWITKGIPLAVGSGISQTANSLTFAGDYLRSGLDYQGTKSTYQAPTTALNPFGGTPDDPSSDSAQYYGQHKAGVDTAGFFLGSLVPTMASIKALKLAQAGLAVTDAGGLATGLLTNTAEQQLLNRAALSIGNASGDNLIWNRLGTSGAAFTQNTLEGMAASVGTYAAMNQSPMYDDVHSIGDFMKDSLTGSIAFGGIGGLFRLANYNSARFLLDGALDVEGNSVTTNLNKVRTATGESQVAAGYISTAPDSLLGATVAVDAKTGLAKDVTQQPLLDSLKQIDKRLPATTDAGEQAGISTPLLRGDLSVTPGDLIAQGYSAVDDATANLLKPASETLGYTGPIANALDAANQSVVSNLKANANTKLSNMITAMVDTKTPEVAAPFKATLDALATSGSDGVQQVNRIMQRAQQVSRVSDNTNNSVFHQALSLEDGTFGNKAMYSLGDLGTVGVKNANTVVLNGKNISLAAGAKDAEGFTSMSPELAQARYHTEYQSLLANPVAKEISPTAIPEWDLPKLEASLRKLDGFTTEADGTISGSVAAQKLSDLKQQAWKDLANSNPDMGLQELALRLNVDKDFFNNPATGDLTTFTNGIDTTALRHVAIKYNFDSTTPNAFELISAARNNVKLQCFQDFQGTIATKIWGSDHNFVDLKIDQIQGVDKFAGLVTSANADLGSQESNIMHIGGENQRIKVKWAQQRQLNLLQGDQGILAAGDGSKPLVELGVVKYLTTSNGDKLVFQRSTGKILKLDDLMAIQDGNLSLEEAAVTHQVQTPEAMAYLKSYVAQDLKRVEQKNLGLQGLGKKIINRYDDGDFGELYFSPPHPEDLKFKVIVKDPNGNVGMLWANDKQTLANKIAATRQSNPELTMFSPEDTDAYYKLQGNYEDNLSLHGYTTVDNLLRRAGIMADLTPTTNAKGFINGIHNDFARSEGTTMNNGLFLKYGQQLAEIKQLEANLGADKLGVDKMMRTMFNWPDRTGAWAQFNDIVEKAADWTGGRAVAAIQDYLRDNGKKNKLSLTAQEAKDFADASSAPIFQSEALFNLSKANTYKGTTKTVLREANSLMRYCVLGIDGFNGMVNLVGDSVLALPEIRAAQAAGIDVPVWKIFSNAIKESTGSSRKALAEEAVQMGMISKNIFAHMDLLDHYALQVGAGSEAEALAAATTVKQKAERFLTKLQYPTALAEQQTHLMSFSISKQLADMRGLVGEERSAYITTQGRKINGNYVAAQRPLIFQGILGQATGLFQTYNFNLFQQATRHLANDNKKAFALLATLQGTIFGASSLPGFELANKAVAAWGGEKKDDAFTQVRKVFGEDASNMLLYGSASTMLGANLWTRGDTNPRQITGIPVDPRDFAQYSYYGKLFKTMASWGDSILKGGNLKVSSLEAIANSGISRPLSGLAEIALGARTTSSGVLNNAVGQDMLSYASALRMLGARPMQEALTANETYKYGVIKAQDQQNMNDIGYALRTQFIDTKGGALDSATINDFAKQYINAGGHPQGFRKWYMANLQKATVPRAQMIAKAMKNSSWASTYQMLASPQDVQGLTPSGSQ